MDRLILVMILTAFIHLIVTLSYSIRLAGLRTRRLLTAISIFNIINLLASASNMIQAPLLTSIVEHSIKTGITEIGMYIPGDQFIHQEAYLRQLALLKDWFRLIILASTAGSIAGAVLTSAFVHFFTRAIRLFEEVGTLPLMLIKIFFTLQRPRLKQQTLNFLTSLRIIVSLAGQKPAIPKIFLVANTILSGIFTTAVLSALYAGALLPDFRSTAVSLSIVVNNIALVVMAAVVETRASLVTDEALQNQAETDVKQLTLYLIITRLVGTILAQMLFLPLASIIVFFAQLLA